jgi:hypothetical protein
MRTFITKFLVASNGNILVLNEPSYIVYEAKAYPHEKWSSP